MNSKLYKKQSAPVQGRKYGALFSYDLPQLQGENVSVNTQGNYVIQDPSTGNSCTIMANTLSQSDISQLSSIISSEGQDMAGKKRGKKVGALFPGANIATCPADLTELEGTTMTVDENGDYIFIDDYGEVVCVAPADSTLFQDQYYNAFGAKRGASKVPTKKIGHRKYGAVFNAQEENSGLYHLPDNIDDFTVAIDAQGDLTFYDAQSGAASSAEYNIEDFDAQSQQYICGMVSDQGQSSSYCDQLGYGAKRVAKQPQASGMKGTSVQGNYLVKNGQKFRITGRTKLTSNGRFISN